jgi:adenine phosphoribosyltransferase
MDFKKFIRDIPDFPKPGILFRDITPLLKDPKAFASCIEQMAEIARSHQPTVITAIESRGFLFAVPIAMQLGLPFIPIRKPGKLPYKSIAVEYSLEYGSGKLEMHEDGVHKDDRVIIVDDLLATGGTARGAATLVENVGATVAGFIFAIELGFLKGRDILKGYPVDCLITYD